MANQTYQHERARDGDREMGRPESRSAIRDRQGGSTDQRRDHGRDWDEDSGRAGRDDNLSRGYGDPSGSRRENFGNREDDDAGRWQDQRRSGADRAYSRGYGQGGYRAGDDGRYGASPDARGRSSAQGGDYGSGYEGDYGRFRSEFDVNHRQSGYRGDFRGGFQGGSQGAQGSSRGDYRSGGYGGPGASGSGLWGDEGRGQDQSHRGRGPKNYQRSDERIAEDVNDRLSDDPDVDASDIEVSVSNREVTLSGEVDSKRAKRCAEDCADSVSGVQHVQNNLRVKKSGSERDSANADKADSKT